MTPNHLDKPLMYGFLPVLLQRRNKTIMVRMAQMASVIICYHKLCNVSLHNFTSDHFWHTIELLLLILISYRLHPSFHHYCVGNVVYS